MWIDEALRRIVTFVVVRVDPIKRLPMRIWYEPESATSIRTGLKPTITGRVHEFRIKHDTLVWKFANHEQAWKRLSPNEYPERLETELAAANARMDDMER